MLSAWAAFSDSPGIACQDQQGVVYPVDVAALVAVGGIDTGANQAVADIKACPEGGLHIGAVVGVHIYGVISAGALGSVNEL